MRVAVICGDRGIGVLGAVGAAAHVRAMASAFAGAGAEVLLLAARLEPPAQQPRLPAPSGVSVELTRRGRWPGVLRRRDPHHDRLVDARAFDRAAVARLRDWKPDVIYERFSLFSAAGRRVKRALGVPWFVELNAPRAWELALFADWKPQRSLLRAEERALEGVDRVLAVSPSLVDYAVRRGVPRERVSCVPNGVSAELLAAGRGPGAPPHPPVDAAPTPWVLGFAGTFKRWHGLQAEVPELVQLARALAPRPLVLDLWGDGPERQPFLDALAGASGPTGPFIEPRLRGWGEPQQISQARSGWDAAWVPLTTWPPATTAPGGVAALERAFGEALPDRWYCPLKAAEARAAGLPIWPKPASPTAPGPARPQTWEQIARSVLSGVASADPVAVGRWPTSAGAPAEVDPAP